MSGSTVRSRRRLWPLFLFLLPALLLAAATVHFLLQPRADPAPALDAALAEIRERQLAALGGEGALHDAACACYRLEAAGAPTQSGRQAEAAVTVTRLSMDALAAGLEDDMQPFVEHRVSLAARRAEIYDENGAYLPAVTEPAYREALQARLTHAEDYCERVTQSVTLVWDAGVWTLQNPELFDGSLPALPASPGYAVACAKLRPAPLHYSLPDRTSNGPLPDPAAYRVFDSPYDALSLLEQPDAQRLIGGQRVDFDPDAALCGRPVYTYLDETILVLIWQQDEHGAVGTFEEVFLADASQLRRKLVDDTFENTRQLYPTALAAEAKAVAALSGDFYNSGRATYGLLVYDGVLRRSCLYAGQSCLFDRNGDMLLCYENDFASDEEVQAFVDANGVSFSLAFGPCLIDRGQDVTPFDYPIGEVRDTYARCALGQLGPLHYLAMTINCESPDHYVYVTLRQAADSMIAHGCYNAYTLDGGQTGSILMGSELINPVQFGVERTMSDIVYFATALPEE